jgi:hypothetical protein
MLEGTYTQIAERSRLELLMTLNGHDRFDRDYIHGHRTSHMANDRIYFRVAIHSTFWKIYRNLKFEICEIPSVA